MSHVVARARTRTSRSAFRRRRLGVLGAALVLGLALAALIVVLGPLNDAFREITLPLRHDDIIRQQAHDKDLDAALIAAVIYEESKFQDRTSHAGARGLMQVTPETARFIARRSGGIRFVENDLAVPQINISYGAFYLRYLLDRYGGDRTLAVAAYNAGLTNVDNWVRRAGGADGFDAAHDIPFPETRGYVRHVLERREQYRHHYARELGY
ncbi:MAG: lytic transglycosylase domain-containing protein [Thermoleophilaceae bacterium]